MTKFVHPNLKTETFLLPLVRNGLAIKEQRKGVPSPSSCAEGAQGTRIRKLGMEGVTKASRDAGLPECKWHGGKQRGRTMFW